jgi:excisionase family DNA binding protein
MGTEMERQGSELEPLLTSEEVAKYLKVDIVTVRRLVGRGELAAYRVGGEYRFTHTQIHDFLQQHRVPACSDGSNATDGLLGQLLGGVLAKSRAGRGRVQWADFTRRAKQAVQCAAEEARLSEVLAPEHLLLGLLRVEEGVAARALADLGINHQKVQQVLEMDQDGKPDQTQEGIRDAPVPLSAETKKAFEAAVKEAKRLKCSYKGTEHLLLGLMDDEDGSVVRLLDHLGVSAAQVRQRVLEVLALQAAG